MTWRSPLLLHPSGCLSCKQWRQQELASWYISGAGSVLGLSLAAALISPGGWGPQAVTPFLLASTVMGYLGGIALPAGEKFVHLGLQNLLLKSL